MQEFWNLEPSETTDVWLRCKECKHYRVDKHGIPYKKEWKYVPKCLKFHCHRPWESNACKSFE